MSQRFNVLFKVHGILHGFLCIFKNNSRLVFFGCCTVNFCTWFCKKIIKRNACSNKRLSVFAGNLNISPSEAPLVIVSSSPSVKARNYELLPRFRLELLARKFSFCVDQLRKKDNSILRFFMVKIIREGPFLARLYVFYMALYGKLYHFTSRNFRV